MHETEYEPLTKREAIKCDTCPRCKDVYPDRVDADGYHFMICGVTGNIVYTIPHKMKRYSGKGYIHLGISGCGLYETIEEALDSMTESEIRRWREAKNDRSQNDHAEELR